MRYRVGQKIGTSPRNVVATVAEEVSGGNVYEVARAADGMLLAFDRRDLSASCEVCGDSNNKCRFESGCSCWYGTPCNGA